MKLEPRFKRRCEGISIDWRHRLLLRAFDPLPAERILETIGGVAIVPDQLPVLFPTLSPEVVIRLTVQQDWSAAIIRRHPPLMLYQPGHSAPRHQSNLMHEIAHLLLDHPMVGFSPVTGFPLRSARQEDEATYLGSCLQIPRTGLQWAMQRGLTCLETASHFGASEEMVRFRANMTGIFLRNNP